MKTAMEKNAKERELASSQARGTLPSGSGTAIANVDTSGPERFSTPIRSPQNSVRSPQRPDTPLKNIRELTGLAYVSAGYKNYIPSPGKKRVAKPVRNTGTKARVRIIPIAYALCFDSSDLLPSICFCRATTTTTPPTTPSWRAALKMNHCLRNSNSTTALPSQSLRN